MKQVLKEAESAKVTIRGARKDGNNDLDKLSKEENVSEDRRDNEKITIQDLTEKYNKEVESLSTQKEKEIMTV